MSFPSIISLFLYSRFLIEIQPTEGCCGKPDNYSEKLKRTIHQPREMKEGEEKKISYTATTFNSSIIHLSGGVPEKRAQAAIHLL